jgi:uncharacterized protein YndB with AHSA1/START domain
MIKTADGKSTVIVERELAAPAEKIWRALTQPHLLEEWLMQNDFKPVKGHKFTLSRDPAPDVKVRIEGEVLEVEPNKTLSYTWAAYGTQTVVTFSLTPTANGTMLRVEQAGFAANQKAAIKGANASWPHFLKALEDLVKKMDD